LPVGFVWHGLDAPESGVNRHENQIRPIAIGRRNWLFVGSLRAGKRRAAFNMHPLPNERQTAKELKNQV
jgi:hypothetical protein